MNTPDEYINKYSGDWTLGDWHQGNNKLYISEDDVRKVIRIAIADAVADGDRRVAEAEAKAEKYKDILVKVIMRSVSREVTDTLRPVPMSAA
jgi:hypothetical protein